MKIAITGATGFIGGSLARHLSIHGHEVLTYGRRQKPESLKYLSYAQWDITHEIIKPEGLIDVVIHCAGAVSDWGEYKYMYQSNVKGTRNVLESFQKASQFIYISTASVYDSYKDLVHVKENEPYAQKYPSYYGLTKMLAEKEVFAYSRSNKVILRPHAVYGPGDTTLTPRILAARKMGKLFAVGNGKNNLSITYIENLLHAVELTIKKEFLSTEVFNIADDLPGNLDEILKALLRAYSLPEKIVYVNRKLALGSAYSGQWILSMLHSKSGPLLTPYIVYELTKEGTLDISKAKKILNYNPKYTFEQGFREQATWLNYNE